MRRDVQMRIRDMKNEQGIKRQSYGAPHATSSFRGVAGVGHPVYNITDSTLKKSWHSHIPRAPAVFF
jgi:hypothetical protein